MKLHITTSGKYLVVLLAAWIIINSIILWVRYEPVPANLQLTIGTETVQMVFVKGGTFQLGESEEVLEGKDNFTRKWLAEQIGKDPGTVSKWCTNTMQPNLETLVKIAECLDVDVKDLLWSIK